MKDLKVVFMGTPEISVPTLENLIRETNVVLVVSAPDKPVGRKQILTPSPVKEVALKNNIPVFQPIKIKDDFKIIEDLNPDIIITFAFGQIISEDILNIPRLGCINIHASLLPKYRGGAPIHFALLNGDNETGITLMHMDKGMDTGDMIVKESIIIEENDNLKTLSDKLSILGSKMIIKHLPSIVTGNAPREKQADSEVTYAYAKEINRRLEHIDFNKTNDEVHNLIRALYPYAYLLMDGSEMKIIETEKTEDCAAPGTIISVDKESFTIACKKGSIKVKKIKPFGKKEMMVKDYFNGVKKESLINKEVK